MAALSEDLELNIGPALSAVGDLSSALDAAVQAAGTALGESLASAIGSLDTSALASLTLPDLTLGADGSALTAEGEAAVQAIDPTIVLQADTADLIAQGDAAMQSVFEAQTSNVALGVGNAEGIIAEGEAATAAAEGVNALSTANKGLDAANAGLEGSVGGVVGALGPLGVATAGVTALAGGFFAEAVNEETALNRLKFVFGDLADSIQQVDLPAANFNLTFQQIAATTGASLPGLEQAVSRIGAIGNSAGAAAPQIAETAKQIVAIATYLAVTNPALGSADQIVNSLTNTLQRGGRSASLLGISLPTKELNAAAQAAVGVGNEVSQFDKIAAGAKIVSDQLGGSLGTAVTAGTNEAALALPKLEEQLKETVAAVGAPLIGPITQLFADLGPPLEQVATAIGRLLQAAAPVAGVLGLVLKVLGDLIGVINAIPLPVLTAAVTAFLGAMAVEKVIAFATGLLVLGANATADVGAVGLLTGAVDGLMASLGPVGIAIAALAIGWEISAARAKSNAEQATAYAQSLIGVKAGTDLASESSTTLTQQLGTVNAKISDLKSQIGGVGGFFAQAFGIDDKQVAQIKALQDEATKLKAALAAANSAAADTSGVEAATKAQKDFAAAIQASAGKLDGVGAALASVESANASLVSSAIGKLPGVAGVFGDVSSAIAAAATAADKQAASSGSASSALATQAQHAKDLRDATAALAAAQKDFNTLAAGPTADQIASGLLTVESAAKGTRDALQKVDDATAALAQLAAGPTADQLAAGLLAVEQAARSTASAQQAVVDAQTALNLLAAGPTADTQAQAQEAVAKAQLNRQKAVLGLNDALDAQTTLVASGTATDRQLQDAQIKVQEAQFALTDASRSLNDAITTQQKLMTDSLPGSRAMMDAQTKLRDAQLALESAQASQQAAQAAQNKLIADSVPGSAALTTAQNNLSDAQLSLAQAQETQAAAQTKQNALFSDALPGSAAYVVALQKISDAQDHLTQVTESGNAKQAASSSAAAKTHVDALSALQTGLDEQIAAEDKFFADLEKIQSEGGTQIVAELLAQGPKTGAAEATAVAGATVTVVQALETKAETLKNKEDQHAQEIATIFGASLNANLVKAFSAQLKNETDFYNNVTRIFEAGNTALANSLLAQGPVQGAALAGAVANATPQVQAALELQAAELKADEARFGSDIGKSFGDGLFTGINAANARVFAAAQQLGASAQAGTASAIAAKSPSLVARGLGLDWGEGLAAGITDSIPLVSVAAAQLANAAVVIPSQAAVQTGSTIAATATTASPSAGGAPSIVNNFNLPAGITDPQGIALAVSARQALAATR